MKFAIKMTAAVIATAAVVNLFIFCSAVFTLAPGQSISTGPITARRAGYRIYYVSIGNMTATLNLLPAEELSEKIKDIYSSESFFSSETAKALRDAFVS